LGLKLDTRPRSSSNAGGASTTKSVRTAHWVLELLLKQDLKGLKLRTDSRSEWPQKTGAGHKNGAALAPIAALPEMQRRGIGGILVRAGLEACRRAGVGFVVVLGDPGFYERFGFERASGRGLRNEYGAESEFMVIELVPQSIPAKGGLVKYAPEFVKLVFDRG
jgi:hypothetical protein